jgi:hypothetical protein
VSEWAKTGAEYVWTLLYDPNRGLLAGTGPDGKVLVIGANGEVKTLVETGAEHVLCLARDKAGMVYGTTSAKGFLFSITSKGKFRIEESFDENEVKRVVPISDHSGEWFAVGVNQTRGRGAPAGLPAFLKKMPSPPSEKGGGPDEGEIRANSDGEGKEKEAPGLPGIKELMAARGPGKISGTVYSVRLGKGKRVLLPLSGAGVTDLAADSNGAVFAATDQGGKVYRIEPQEAIYAVEFDLKAEQTLALAVEGGKLRWIGSGMPGDLTRSTDQLSARAEYYSEVFDAGFPARWGKFTERGEGQTRIETRSGNTEEHDEGWSEWQALPEKTGLVASPPARYLQARASWPKDGRSVLQVFNVAYAVANQPHYVEQVEVSSAPERPSEKSLLPRPALLDQDKSKETSPPERERPSSRPPAESSTKIQVRWKVDNPDGDQLVYKLSYQPEGYKKWIPIQTDKDITRPRYEWDTESIPDGYYRIKVWASDEKANPPDQVMVAEKESKPFLIDNRRPEVTGLKVAAKNTVTGAAKDQTSPIARLDYSLDGQDWVPVAPADGIFDQLEESFEFTLPANTPSGPHTLAVRAYDKAENQGVNQITFTIP